MSSSHLSQGLLPKAGCFWHVTGMVGDDKHCFLSSLSIGAGVIPPTRGGSLPKSGRGQGAAPRVSSVSFYQTDIFLLPSRTLIHGDKKGGFTIFWADDGLDTGDLLLQKECEVLPDDTVSTLYNRFLFPEGIKGMVRLRAGHACPPITCLPSHGLWILGSAALPDPHWSGAHPQFQGMWKGVLIL